MTINVTVRVKSLSLDVSDRHVTTPGCIPPMIL